MTPREIRQAVRELERQERDEISVCAKPIREKYQALKGLVRDQCEHKYSLNLDHGVCPWDEHWFCNSCGKREYRCNEDIKQAYMKSNPELFEELEDE